MKKYIFLLCWVWQASLAQNDKLCATRQPTDGIRLTHAPQPAARTEDDQTYVLPVIVHILHIGENIGVGSNISKEQVYSQFEVLNEDFNRQNPDRSNTLARFEGAAANAKIRFVPAQIDINGQSLQEAGIRRLRVDKFEYNTTNEISDLARRTIWNPKQYLNIIVVGRFTDGSIGLNLHFPDSSGLAGLKDVHGTSQIDAVVVRHNRFGSYAKFAAPQLEGQRNNLGRTTTHEIGHYLGLLHIWGNNGGCNDDDFCADTPNTSQPSFNCPLEKLACDGNLAMVQNYMEYSDDFCMNIFTNDQVARMRQVLRNSPQRKELSQSPVLEIPKITTKVAVYPNPAQDFIQIRGFKAVANYQIHNILGQIMQTGTIQDQQIDISRLSPAVYILQIQQDDNQVFTQKIIIY